MERLVGQNYFDHRRKDEDRMVNELGLDASETVTVEDEDLGIDFKDFKAVHTACINFGKDRFDILRGCIHTCCISCSGESFEGLLGCNSLKVMVVQSNSMYVVAALSEKGNFMVTIHLKSFL